MLDKKLRWQILPSCRSRSREQICQASKRVYANIYDEMKDKIVEIYTPTEISHIKNMELRRLFNGHPRL